MTVMVISEIGRTFRENGNRGTDHGHGSTYWRCARRVTSGGGRAQNCLTATTLVFQNRDRPVLNDYRSVLAGCTQRAVRAAGAGPGASGVVPRDLGLI
jgi:uncharacterized protein (DUF1501 family)